MSWIKDSFWKNTTYRSMTWTLLLGGPIWDILIYITTGDIVSVSTILTWSVLLLGILIAYLKRNSP